MLRFILSHNNVCYRTDCVDVAESTSVQLLLADCKIIIAAAT